MQFKDIFDKLFEFSEDFIYVVIGLILIITAIFLVIDSFYSFLHFKFRADMTRNLVELLDKTLLLLMLIEILYTVKLSFKSHHLSAEPFLIVALIAVIRRILVISVETAYLPEKFEPHMIEISILGVLIIIFVASYILINKHAPRIALSQQTEE
ncbi:MAG: hypothetical protein Kow0037_06130 [Calditrichia bacterium]